MLSLLTPKEIIKTRSDELTKFIAQETSNDSMLKVAKFKAYKSSNMHNGGVLEYIKNTLISKPLIVSKISRYWFCNSNQNNVIKKLYKVELVLFLAGTLDKLYLCNDDLLRIIGKFGNKRI